MADKAEIVRATGKSCDGLTGEPIPAGMNVAHITINKRCAPFFTAESLRRLADEIEKGPGVLFDACGPACERVGLTIMVVPERWPEHGWLAHIGPDAAARILAGCVLLETQNQLQQVSMMLNIEKSRHETQMAAIRNIRVG